MKISGKKVFITGGNSGIGAALADQMVKEKASHLAIMSRNLCPEDIKTQSNQDVKYIGFRGDVTSKDDRQNILSQIEREWSGLDILVNCAGVVSAGSLEEISEEDIIKQIEINLTGLILMTKTFLPILKKSKEAAIVNVSSIIGLINIPFYCSYAATKGGITSFSDSLRRELSGYPIHVMTLYPGATDTPMMKTADMLDMETAEAVAASAIEGLKNNCRNVIRGGEHHSRMIKANMDSPQEIDRYFSERLDTLYKKAYKHRSI